MMEVRKLNAGDVFTVVKILGPEIDDLVKASKSGGTKEEKAEAIGAYLGEVLLDRHIDEAWGWIASLAGMSVEEFNEQPPDAPFDVIASLVEEEDVAGFFERVRSSVARISKAKIGSRSQTG